MRKIFLLLALLFALPAKAVVNTALNSVSYACDGSTATFTVNFPYLAYTDLTVTSTTAGGAVTALVYTADYTVNFARTASTATLTLVSPSTKCPVGSTLKIARVVALTQLQGFRAQTNYVQSLHEDTYDRLEMQIQQLNNTGVVAVLATPLSESNGGTGVAALTCTNQFVTSNGTAYSCSTDTLASAQHANQGTTTTTLHGNAAGNPSFGAVALGADVSGTLPEARGGTNAGAITCTATQVVTSDGTSYSCATPPGIGSTGSAVPSTAQYEGGKDSNGNLLGVRICDKSLAVVATALNGSQQLIAGTASQKIYICGGYLISSAAVSVKFVESATSGNACATSPSDTTGAAPLAANGGYTMGLNGYAVPFLNTAGDALCINTSGAATVGGWISYTQQVP